jgi:hypothetical protein
VKTAIGPAKQPHTNFPAPHWYEIATEHQMPTSNITMPSKTKPDRRIRHLNFIEHSPSAWLAAYFFEGQSQSSLAGSPGSTTAATRRQTKPPLGGTLQYVRVMAWRGYHPASRVRVHYSEKRF